jgi:predicted RNA binding protein YcfA (HicA-like mRNA interferase family)
MPRKGRDLNADLRTAGFVPARQSCSHVTWVHERFGAITVTLALKDNDDAHFYDEKNLRDALAGVRAREEKIAE